MHPPLVPRWALDAASGPPCSHCVCAFCPVHARRPTRDTTSASPGTWRTCSASWPSCRRSRAATWCCPAARTSRRACCRPWDSQVTHVAPLMRRQLPRRALALQGVSVGSGTAAATRAAHLHGFGGAPDAGLGAGGGFERLHFLLESFFDSEGDINPAFLKVTMRRRLACSLPPCSRWRVQGLEGTRGAGSPETSTATRRRFRVLPRAVCAVPPRSRLRRTRRGTPTLCTRCCTSPSTARAPLRAGRRTACGRSSTSSARSSTRNTARSTVRMSRGVIVGRPRNPWLPPGLRRTATESEEDSCSSQPPRWHVLLLQRVRHATSERARCCGAAHYCTCCCRAARVLHGRDGVPVDV